MAKKRLFIVGLDGATWRILDPLLKKGKLPFLTELKEKGASGILESVTPPLTPAAWSSFQTGVNPGKHGIFGFLNYRKNPSDPPFYTSGDIKSDKIWDLLGREGGRSLIINMPLSYPVYKMRGILVSSFLTPPGARFAYPHSVETLLNKMNYTIDFNEGKRGQGLPTKSLNRKKRKEVLEKLIDISKKRVEVFKKLSKTQDFSFFFLLFKETDIAQHIFYDEEETRKYYMSLDKMLRELHEHYINNFSGEKNFLIISDHGFHLSAPTQFSPYEWLRQASYLSKTKRVKTKLWELSSLVHSLFKRSGLSLTGFDFIKKLRKRVLTDIETSELEDLVKQFGLQVTFEGIYFYNKKTSISDKKKLVNKLKDVSFEGKRVFQEVKLAKEIYSGRFAEQGPDIIWLPNEEFVINISTVANRVFSPRPTNLKGDHVADKNGIFLAVGKALKNIGFERISIMDIFPLACHLLGITIPEGLDGKLPTSILKNRPKTKSKTQEEIVRLRINKELSKIETDAKRFRLEDKRE